MLKLSWLSPTNLLEEKEKFLANPDHNPQFIYKDNRKFSTTELTEYGLPKSDYLELAQQIIDKAFGSLHGQDYFELEGEYVDQTTTEQHIQQFLADHGLTEQLQVIFSSSFQSGVSLLKDKPSQPGPSTLKLQTPIKFRNNTLQSMIYHELGTHLIRRYNHEQQPWFYQPNLLPINPIKKLITEEGLAALHALLARNFKYAVRWALSYLTVAKAQKLSFLEIWAWLGQYIKKPTRLWHHVFRRKRGLTDTSQPGGYTKDLVYFEGIVDVYHYLEKNDFDITKLYFGKIAIEDIERAVKLNPDFKPLLPKFFTDDPTGYKKAMLAIGQLNLLSSNA